MCCSAASDYRKRRKSEPSSSQANAQSNQGRAVSSPKPVDAYRPSSSLKKPVIRSSPSSPSRAKGTHKHLFSLVFFSLCLVSLFPLLCPTQSYIYTYHIAWKSKRICCIYVIIISIWSFLWLVLVKVWGQSLFFSFFFSLPILFFLPSSSTLLLGITA